MRLPLCSRTLLFASLLVAAPVAAEARTEDECQRAWAQAVRSFLTQKRSAGPDGKEPGSLDQQEAVTQAWAQAFGPACKVEGQGDKPRARVEAAAIGAEVLSRLDPKACLRFMEFYMQSSRPRDVCAAAADGERVRTEIKGSIPARS